MFHKVFKGSSKSFQEKAPLSSMLGIYDHRTFFIPTDFIRGHITTDDLFGEGGGGGVGFQSMALWHVWIVSTWDRI